MLGAFSKLGALDEMVVKFASPSLERPLLIKPILPLIKHETKVILKMYVYHKAEEGEGSN
jgi:hypothetical protein